MDDPKLLWNAIHSQAGKALGEDFWQEISRLMPSPGPRMDIYQTDSEVVAVVELPGLTTLDSIKMSLSERHLLLRGDLGGDYPVDDEAVTLRERYSGRFQRKVTLPCDVEAEGAKIAYRQGLLTVRFVKKPMAGIRHIPLQVEPPEGQEGESDG